MVVLRPDFWRNTVNETKVDLALKTRLQNLKHES